MELFNLQSDFAPRVLATDLDGTLIPLPQEEGNRVDLAVLKEELSMGGKEIVFSTGRHFESVLEAIEEYGLPQPEWMICDVGSSIYRAGDDGYQLYGPYLQHLEKKVAGVDRKEVAALFEGLGELKFQGPESQGSFKISYFTHADLVDELVERIEKSLSEHRHPFSVIGSIDPFNQNGLIDLLPTGVSKAYALKWLSTHADFRPEEVVFAGDSGNDYAALVAGFRSIAVGNASRSLVDKVRGELTSKGAGDRFYAAKAVATSGVLEGCRHFGLID